MHNVIWLSFGKAEHVWVRRKKIVIRNADSYFLMSRNFCSWIFISKIGIKWIKKNQAADLEIGFLIKSISKPYSRATVISTAWESKFKFNLRFFHFNKNYSRNKPASLNCNYTVYSNRFFRAWSMCAESSGRKSHWRASNGVHFLRRYNQQVRDRGAWKAPLPPAVSTIGLDFNPKT